MINLLNPEGNIKLIFPYIHSFLKISERFLCLISGIIDPVK